MAWYLEGAATEEGPGANWTPPTIGNFMAGEGSRIRRLREADATRQVAREARIFHEKKALRYGVNTKRGLAHFKASLRYGREGRLQEMFGDAADTLPPKAWAKASTDAAKFHQKQAEKHGLDSPVGQAHVAEMQHHQEMAGQALQQHKQLSQQKAQQQAQQPKPSKIVKPAPVKASSEGGPGSGRHADAGKTAEQRGYKHSGTTGQGTKLYSHPNGSRLAVRTDGTWSHSSSSGAKVDSGRRGRNLGSHLKKESREALPGHSSKQSPVPVPKKSEQPSEDIRQNKPPIPLDPQDANKPGAVRVLQQGQNCSASRKRERAIRNFAREGGRGPYDDQDCTLPRKVRKQMGDDLLFRAKRTGEAAEGGPGSGRHKGVVSDISKTSGGRSLKSVSLGHLHRLRKEAMQNNEFSRAMKIGRLIRSKSSEAGNNYVAPRYDKSHPEGFTDKRYSGLKNGIEGGPGSGRHEGSGTAAKFLSQELRKRGMKSKDVPDVTSYKKESKRKVNPRVMESNRDEDEPRLIDLREFYAAPSNAPGWRGGVAFSPGTPKVQQQESGLVIKEF